MAVTTGAAAGHPPHGGYACIHMEKLPTTIEGLAAMINTHRASREDVQALDKKVTEGFERIEHLLLAEQTQVVLPRLNRHVGIVRLFRHDTLRYGLPE